MNQPARQGMEPVDGGDAQVIDLGEARRRRDLRTEAWVKKERVAEFFGVSTRTVYRWVREGCPVKRLRGGALRFQLGALAEWHGQRT